MKKKVCPLFLPHEKNDYHTPLFRYYVILPLTVLFILTQITLSVFYSTNPQVLSFATSIYQQDFFRLINEERTASSLSPLTENTSLNQAAALKAKDMFAKDYWAHISPDGTTPWYFFDLVGYDYTFAGENLAKDFNTSAGVVAGWMSSPSHRENMLNPKFQEMGIAVVNGVLQGEETTLVVQLFGTSYETVTQTSANQSVTVGNPENTQNSIPAVVQNIPTNTPQPTSAPTPIPTVILYPASISTEQVAGENQVYTTGLDQNVQVLKAKMEFIRQPENWSLSQIVSVVFFGTLLILLLGDSFILWQKGIKRQNSHSLMHAGILSVLLLLSIFSGFGSVV